MYLPNQDKIFGSSYLKIESPAKFDDEKKSYQNYYQEYAISRTHWMHLDNAEFRCNSDRSKANTTECITNYLENQIGCSMGLQRTNFGLKKLISQYKNIKLCNKVRALYTFIQV